MLYLISAYATEARLVLAQEKVLEKNNEITVIPKLLEWLDLRGTAVMIDGMGWDANMPLLIKSLKKKETTFFL